MRFYGKTPKALNETEGLAGVINRALTEYGKFRDGTLPEDWGTAPADGSLARFDNNFGIGPLTRTEALMRANVCLHAMECRGVPGESATDNWWPSNHKSDPECSGGGKFGSAWDLYQHSDFRTVQMIIYGASNFPDGRTGLGPGYFMYGLNRDDEKVSLAPNITPIDISAWLSFQQGVDSRRQQKGKGQKFDELSLTIRQNYKVLLMTVNTLDPLINPSITWILPVKNIESGYRENFKRDIRLAAAGTNYAQADEWIKDYYLSSTVMKLGGSAVFWQLNGKGRGDKNAGQNNTFINDQIRSWAQAIISFQHSAYPGWTWEKFLDEGITWGELNWRIKNLPEEGEIDIAPFRQLDAAGLLVRLKRQQTEQLTQILNQPIEPVSADWWDKMVAERDKEEEEPEPEEEEEETGG